MLSDLIFGYLLRLDEYSDVKGLEYIVALTTSSYKNEAACRCGYTQIGSSVKRFVYFIKSFY